MQVDIDPVAKYIPVTIQKSLKLVYICNVCKAMLSRIPVIGTLEILGTSKLHYDEVIVTNCNVNEKAVYQRDSRRKIYQR